MSVQAMSWAFDLALPPAEKLVLLSLANHANKHGKHCYPGQDTIAEEASMSDRSVRTHLASLEAKGLISRHSRMREDGRGRSSDGYVLHMTRHTDQPENPAGWSDQPENPADQPERSRTTNRKPLSREPSVEPSVEPTTPHGRTTESHTGPSATQGDERGEGTPRPQLQLVTELATAADKTFDAFWEAYPRGHRHGRPGGDGPKAPARQAWRKLTPAQRQLALAGAKTYAAELQRDEKRPYAVTWLNQRRWEDLREPSRPPPQSVRDGVAGWTPTHGDEDVEW